MRRTITEVVRHEVNDLEEKLLAENAKLRALLERVLDQQTQRAGGGESPRESETEYLAEVGAGAS